MKTTLLLLTLMNALSLNAYSSKAIVRKNIPENKVYKQILANNPKIDKVFARKLSNSINKFALKYKMDPHRAAAIAMQESGYKHVSTYKDGKYFDVGMFQFNIRTIKERGIDKKRVLKDLDYTVENYFKIMAEKKELCKSLKEDAWVCYHSRTKHLRTKYKKLVNRYYVVN